MLDGCAVPPATKRTLHEFLVTTVGLGTKNQSAETHKSPIDGHDRTKEFGTVRSISVAIGKVI